MRKTRVVVVGLCAVLLAACGVRGPLEPAAPLWGATEREAPPPPQTFEDDIGLEDDLPVDEIANAVAPPLPEPEDEPGDDTAP